MKKVSLIVLLLSVVAITKAQDLEHYKNVIKELASKKYQGRGYAANGVNKAACYLEQEYRKAGVDEIQSQPFALDINTFPGKAELKIDGKKLQAGKDFVMREYSPGAHGAHRLYYIDTLNYDSKRIFTDLAKPENKGVYVVCDFWFTYKHSKDFRRMENNDSCLNAGMVYVWNTPLKFYKAYGERVVKKPIVWGSPSFPKHAKIMKIDVDNVFRRNFECRNIVAKINGTHNDSTIVFVAHYDHLGNLGKGTYFPGVNDNASGTAALVTLAKHYAKPHNRPKYDMLFLSVAGEEAGLRGSEYYASHPLYDLDKIKYLINLDMIGDNNPVQYCEVSRKGQPGFELFRLLNDKKHYFQSLKQGELAANSDHYPFAEKGVPAILFENESGDCFPHYHTPYDDLKNIRLNTYPAVFQLITDFVSAVSKGAKVADESPTVRIDEYVELCEILARLGGVANFCGNYAPAYQHDIETYFEAVKDHPAVLFMKRVAAERLTPYAAIPALGANIKYDNGKFTYSGDSSQHQVIRWEQSLYEEFMPLLADFYEKSKFHQFYERHQSTYDKAANSFAENYISRLDTDWFKSFFHSEGESKFSIIIGMNNGFGNYSIEKSHLGKPNEHIAIMLYAADMQSTPCYGQCNDLLPIIVHEFCHSYYKANELQRAIGVKLLNEHREEMAKHGYGSWQEMIEESLVRATTIRYFIDHNAPEEMIRKQIDMERNAYGFVWLPVKIEEYKGDLTKIFDNVK